MGIELIGIEKSWHKVPVLQQVSFRTSPGETLVLLGPSGAGKSSLLRMMNLLDTPDAGVLRIGESEFSFPNSLSAAEFNRQSQLLRRKVGMVFQQYNLWPHLTVMENLIEAPVKVLGMSKEAAIEKGAYLLAQLQLADKRDAWPARLSGGQQQRVAIARTLMMDPEVLLFDEPTAALDPEITKEVAEIIRNLSQTGITQVVVTHEVDFARKVASQVIYLEKGRIIESGTSAIFQSPQTSRFAEFLMH
ncbi:ATP-binding cassette domain-containing protein [Aeromonas veronii]|uniref:Arginine transport ATP-binding protein ArtP n=1 Tax=Aeromonas veronii TaxID=654 RepID=A0AAN1UR50_AERVE|nr:ATP-binding cassette domain-containing protein [Aeromonas veronii]AYV38635.1 ATP-binding cassette domain-containing protein [Aeromonas veronii]MCF5768668.1 ATP-binding cassette domain-containing protein [Aeromonas veronii]